MSSKNALQPFRTLLHSSRTQPSWRCQTARLFSTTRPSHIDNDRQNFAESSLLNSLSEDGPSRTPRQSTPIQSLAARAGGGNRARDLLLQRAARDAAVEPYGNRKQAHHIHVYAHKRSTLLTLTRPNHEPMLNLSCGQMGFRHAKRKGYDPAHQLTSYFLAQIQERGWMREIKAIEVVFREFGPGREAFIKLLMGNEGKRFNPLVTRVSDATKLKFGGTRSPQKRRLG